MSEKAKCTFARLDAFRLSVVKRAGASRTRSSRGVGSYGERLWLSRKYFTVLGEPVSPAPDLSSDRARPGIYRNRYSRSRSSRNVAVRAGTEG